MMYLGDQAVGIATSLPIFGDIAKIECGNYTPTVNEEAYTKYFSHSLGDVADFILWFSPESCILPIDNEYMYILSGYMAKRNVSSSSNTASLGLSYVTVGGTTVNTLAGSAILEDFCTTNTFRFFSVPDAKLQAGRTYHYVIGKFKEVTSNA